MQIEKDLQPKKSSTPVVLTTNLGPPRKKSHTSTNEKVINEVKVS